jgi:hypothetical protein
MGRVCNTHGTDEKCAYNFSREAWRKYHMGNSVDCMIRLKCILGVRYGCMDRIHPAKYTDQCRALVNTEWNLGSAKQRRNLWDFKFSRRRVWSSESSGMYCPDDGGSTYLWNVGRHSINNTAVHPTRVWASTEKFLARWRFMELKLHFNKWLCRGKWLTKVK